MNITPEKSNDGYPKNFVNGHLAHPVPKRIRLEDPAKCSSAPLEGEPDLINILSPSPPSGIVDPPKNEPTKPPDKNPLLEQPHLGQQQNSPCKIVPCVEIPQEERNRRKFQQVRF